MHKQDLWPKFEITEKYSSRFKQNKGQEKSGMWTGKKKVCRLFTNIASAFQLSDFVQVTLTLSLSRLSSWMGQWFSGPALTIAWAVSAARFRSLAKICVKCSFWSRFATRFACSMPTSDKGTSRCPAQEAESWLGKMPERNWGLQMMLFLLLKLKKYKGSKSCSDKNMFYTEQKSVPDEVLQNKWKNTLKQSVQPSSFWLGKIFIIQFHKVLLFKK